MPQTSLGEEIPDRASARTIVSALLVFGSLWWSVWIVVALVRYFQATTVVQRWIVLEGFKNDTLIPAAALSGFFGIIISRNRKKVSILGLAIGILCVVAAFFLKSDFLIAAAILAVALFSHWVSPLTFTGAVVALFAASVSCLPYLLREPYSRPMTSRLHTDHRSLATAIESYHSDNGAYPAWTMEREQAIDWDSKTRMPTFMRHGENGPNTLTTPIAYVTALFLDPFHRLDEERTFAYWVPPDGTGWILISPGPDCVFDLTFEELPRAYDPANRSEPSAILLSEFTYDPTNGTVSGGDLWRVRQ